MWGVSSVSIPPSFGRRCPQGGGWGAERYERQMMQVENVFAQITANESTRAPLTLSPVNST